MSRICTNCGNRLPDGSAFCPVCGTPAPAESASAGGFCRKCGTPLAAGAVFCANCGTPVSSAQNDAGNSSASAPTGSSSQDFWGASPQQQNFPQSTGSPDMQSGNSQNNTSDSFWGSSAPQQNYGQPNFPQQNSRQQNYGQPNFPQQNSRQLRNGGTRSAARPRGIKSNQIPIILIAIAAVVIIAAVFAVKGIVGLIKGGKDVPSENFDSGVTASFENLCDMTSLGAQSYVYARMVTEQLLETDLASADPEYVNSLFDECLDAWKAAEEVAGNMTEMSEKLSSDADLDKVKGNQARINAMYKKPVSGGLHFPFAIEASANAPDFWEGDDISGTSSPSESVQQCSVLGSQFRSDSQSGYAAVSSLRSVYSGRTTSVSSWSSAVSSVSSSFSTEMYVSGQITSGRFTQITNGTRSVHTLSNTMKGGTVGVSNTDILVDVGSDKSCVVYSSNSGITMNREQFGGYNPETNSRTISINTNPASSNETEVTFHSTSFFSWFRIDRVGGFTITRGNKGETTPITPPVVGTVSVDPTNLTPPEIIKTCGDGGYVFPETPRGSVNEIIPRTDPTSIRDDSDNIRNGGTPHNTTTVTPVNNPQGNLTDEEITNRINRYGAGVGPITITLIWQTYDDLDLHTVTPDNSRIYYGNKTAQGGTLDVDKNAHSDDLTNEPIENIVFPNPENGHYKIYIRDYRDRTEGYSTHYQVKVKIGENVQMFEGDIDITDTELFIFEFDYNGHVEDGGDTDPGADFDGTLISRGAHTGTITVSMKWNRYDDVDLHMNVPGDKHIYYGNKNTGGGILDVDANAGGQRILDPVENIYFESPSNGHYKVYIHQYSDRSDDSASYIVRVTVDGEVREFRGTIDTTGTEIPIYEFDYNGASETGTATFNGHRYRYYENSDITWTEARAMCQSMGGHLVTITSAEEQAFIESTYPGTTGWIGAYGDNSGWSWITGESFGGYSKWKSGEPNDQGGIEWCGHLWNDMTWNDLDNEDTNGYQKGFYCEFDSLYDTGIGIPSASENTNVTAYGGHTYAYYDTVCSWEQAYEYCRSMGGHLATITCEEEQAKIEEIISPGTQAGYWLGAKRETSGTGASFAWITGESFEYTNWYSGQPDYYMRSEEYLMLYRDSRCWNDLDNLSDYISGSCGYICEWDSVSGSLTIPGSNDNTSVNSFNGHTYAYYDYGYTWDDAERYCESMGGHLVTITSAEEQSTVESVLAGGTKYNYWIGGKVSDNQLTWVTGETASYTHWSGGQPDNSSQYPDDDRAEIHRVDIPGLSAMHWGDIHRSGEYNDTYFGLHNFGFICEWDSLNPNIMDENLINNGAQSGDITISLLWDTYDDLDLHVFAPDGSEIYYSNPSACGGELDVDANANSERKTNPVENIYFAEPVSGEYWVYVYNYTDRTEGSASNYLVRISVGGESQTFSGTIANEDDSVEIFGFNYTAGAARNTTPNEPIYPDFFGTDGSDTASGNLLVNGDASNGLNGWTVPDGKWDTETLYDGVEAYNSYYFYTKGFTGSDGTRMYQDVNISGNAGKNAVLSAQNRAYRSGHADESMLMIEFLDSSGRVIDSASSERDHGNAEWHLLSAASVIPTDAVTARVSLYSFYKTGSESDSYFDNVSFTVS